MNIQEGNYYISRNGELVGPMEDSFPQDDAVWYAPEIGLYRAEGSFGFGDIRCEELDITQTVDDAARKHVEGN